jgi:hypothetical protein
LFTKFITASKVLVVPELFPEYAEGEGMWLALVTNLNKSQLLISVINFKV